MDSKSGQGKAARKSNDDNDFAIVKGKRGKKNTDDEVSPPKQEDSENTEASIANPNNKVKIYNPDKMLSSKCPNAVVHEDFACMLNQTNIAEKENKFYVIQVARVDKDFRCFTHWGRVGEKGQDKLYKPETVDDAINTFKKIFNQKTQNDWEERENFTSKPNKYTLIEIDTDDAGPIKKELVPNKESSEPPNKTRSDMSEMKLDVKRMPLGRLSSRHLEKGLKSLEDIEKAIEKSEPKKLMDLSSMFYTLVPHNFGRRQTPPVLNCVEIVKALKEDMLTLLKSL